MFTGDRCFIGFNFQTDMRFIMNAIILILLFSFAFAESEQPDIATTTTSIASEGVSLTTSTEETQTNSTTQVTQNDTTATTSTSTLETTEEESTLMTTTTSIAQTEYNIRIDENDTILTENEIIHMSNVNVCNKFVNEHESFWIVLNKSKTRYQCRAQLAIEEYGYRKWWKIGVTLVVLCSVTCCCSCLLSALDLYIRLNDKCRFRVYRNSPAEVTYSAISHHSSA